MAPTFQYRQGVVTYSLVYCAAGAGLSHSNQDDQHVPSTIQPLPNCTRKAFVLLPQKACFWEQQSQVLEILLLQKVGKHSVQIRKRRPFFCPGKCCSLLLDLPPLGY